ncbi:hypothetical protein TKV_c05380 [Thermoanaerobacter kivui]|uniref:Uncharacterized protein n=1 Tax=Thermoanaerobacter kivui TaxID=2325 RepID=A0A097APJ1_THEKI|nr:hypothetical protein TKV_c05380 [Thermoanaerobacter kivui]
MNNILFLTKVNDKYIEEIKREMPDYEIVYAQSEE